MCDMKTILSNIFFILCSIIIILFLVFFITGCQTLMKDKDQIETILDDGVEEIVEDVVKK